MVSAFWLVQLVLPQCSYTVPPERLKKNGGCPLNFIFTTLKKRIVKLIHETVVHTFYE